MKRILTLAAVLCLFATSAFAGIGGVGNNTIWFSSPNTLADALGPYCTDGNFAVDIDNNIVYQMNHCAGTAVGLQIAPATLSGVSGLTAALAAKYNNPSGTTIQYLRGDGTLATLNTSNVPEFGSTLYFTNARATSAIAAAYFTGSTAQYIRGDGSLATFPTAGAWTFNYPSRALTSCFQISSTQDASFSYNVDISATITLGGGTAVLTSYTNSGCSTGAQAIANGAVSSVALLGTSSIPLNGWLPAGKWAKITATASGGGTAAIDAVQAEALKP